MTCTRRAPRAPSLLRSSLAALLAGVVLVLGLGAPAHAAPGSTAHAAARARPTAAVQPTRVDRRCATGRVVCIDKSERTLRWMVDGRTRLRMAVRFGAPSTPTREGTFRLYRKSRDHVSREFGSPMPFAMFFSGGEAVHYSSDFARRGYAGASHGCVNVRDYAKVRDLFGRTRVGDRVVVKR